MHTHSSHGVDAIDVVVGPAGGQLVWVLLLLEERQKKKFQIMHNKIIFTPLNDRKLLFDLIISQWSSSGTIVLWCGALAFLKQ